jgi:hypothetical protein
MVKVYFWNESNIWKAQPGHSAMDIAFGEDVGRARYVSWWPVKREAAALNGGVEGFAHKNYAVDRDDEGSEADGAVEIYGLDESRMIEEWDSILLTSSVYSLTNRNCAHLVTKILSAGLMGANGGAYPVIKNYNHPEKDFTLTPRRAQLYAWAIRDYLRDKGHR